MLGAFERYNLSISNGGFAVMLSDNIKNYRKQKGYTQETLAQSLNIVRQTVSKWEKGYSVPDADMLEKLSEVLEVSVSDLLGAPSEPAQKVSELERISAQLAVLNEQMARELVRRKRNRKIGIVLGSVAAFLLLVGLFFIFVPVVRERNIPAGDVSHTEIVKVDSEIYFPQEIDVCIDIIMRDFENDWDGCELTIIYYAGDSISSTESEERGVSTIVLRSCFNTGRLPNDSSLNENSTYEDWYWILTRKAGGVWRHVDHGYI